MESRRIGAEPLHGRVTQNLKRRLRSGEWAAGDRLPSESELATEYRVSRSTVRMSLKLLEAQGLTSTRHGSGSYVTAFGTTIRAGLQELKSMTATIAEQGHVPGMAYRSAVLRPGEAEEALRLSRPEGFTVLALERAVLADGVVVAFSYDSIPADLLPRDFRPDEVSGSTFGLLDQQAGVLAVQAFAELHSVRSEEVGWGDGRPADGLYLLLDQLHVDRRGTPVMHSRVYFIEGRFQFAIVRTR